MADIYIAYGSEDRRAAQLLYELLSLQWEVWWDDKIVGRFSDAIETEITRSACIVALCSKISRRKDAFLDELRLSRNSKAQLLPVRLDDSPPPYEFGGYSYTELSAWDGEADHVGYRQLVRRISAVVEPRSKPRRPLTIGGRVQLPTLFLSVSSHETQLVPAEAIHALRVSRAPAILVSAYDLVSRKREKPKAIIRAIAEYRKAGGFVLIDSGNYESTRLADREWTTKKLREALLNAEHDWAFCFDVIDSESRTSKAIEQVVKAVKRDSRFTSAPILPIVHAPIRSKGGYNLKNIHVVIRGVAEQLQPKLIAIPERELGDGLISRAETVIAIRNELAKLSFYQPLHILGTGNPWSIAILAAAGADTFDGLEWCRFTVDHDGDRLHHFQHFDFYKGQASHSALAKTALESPKVAFAGKVAFHNLEYYITFAKIMRDAVADDRIEPFIVGLLGKKVNLLSESLPELFK
jgi:queuine/archaeosine tRNA-ribosyltransferase